MITSRTEKYSILTKLTTTFIMIFKKNLAEGIDFVVSPVLILLPNHYGLSYKLAALTFHKGRICVANHNSSTCKVAASFKTEPRVMWYLCLFYRF